MNGDISVGITATSANIAVEFCVLFYGGHSFSFVLSWINLNAVENYIAAVVCLFVCFSALEYCLNVENMNLSAIRTIRVLRPLRAINRIPSKFPTFN
jgi:hypothetical protein